MAYALLLVGLPMAAIASPRVTSQNSSARVSTVHTPETLAQATTTDATLLSTIPSDDPVYSTIPAVFRSAELGFYARDVEVDVARGVAYVPGSPGVAIVSLTSLSKVGLIPLGPASRIDMSSDGSTLYATVDDTTTVAVIDLNSLQVTAQIDVAAGTGQSAVYDVTEGKPGHVYVSSRNGIALIQTQEANAVSRVASSQQFTEPFLAADPSGTALYVQTGDEIVKLDISQASAPVVDRQYVAGMLASRPPMPSADGKLIFLVSGDVLHTDSLEHAFVLPAGSPLPTSDGRRVYVVRRLPSDTPVLETYSVPEAQLIAHSPLGCGDSPAALAQHPSGTGLLLVRDIVCVTAEPAVVNWSPSSRQLGGAGHDVEYDAQRGRAYVSVPSRNVVAVVDVESMTIIDRIWVGSIPREIEISEDINTLYIALEGSGSVAMLDLSSLTIGTPIRVQEALGSPGAYALAVGPNDQVFVAHGFGDLHFGGLGYLAMIDVAAGHRVSRVHPQSFGATRLLVDRERALLYALDSSAFVKFDVSGTLPQLLLNLTGQQHPRGITLSQDGNRIYSDSGRTIDTSTGTEIEFFRVGPKHLSGDGSGLVVIRELAYSMSTVEVYSEPDRALVGFSEATCGSSPVRKTVARPPGGEMLILTSEILCSVGRPQPVIATISGVAYAETGGPICATALVRPPGSGEVVEHRTVTATTPEPFNHEFVIPLAYQGDYTVYVWYCTPSVLGASDFGFEFLDDAPTFGSARVFHIQGGENITVDLELDLGGAISGQLYQPDGFYAYGIEVTAVDSSGFQIPSISTTDGQGQFQIGGLRHGTAYRLLFTDPSGTLETQYYEVPGPRLDDLISVTAGRNTQIHTYLKGPMPTNIGLVDPTTGKWYLRTTGYFPKGEFYYGNPGDVPFMGDWDCDGIATPGLYRPSDAYAYLRNSNDQGNADVKFFFGNPGDVPLAGDWDGDGCDTLSIYRPSNQTFYIINRLGSDDGGLGASDFSFVFGNPGDQAVRGDWDGDGVDEIGLYRKTSGYFYYRNSLDTGVATGQFYFGNPGDRFIAGDWGVPDGRDTPAVYRPSSGAFYFRHSLSEGNADQMMFFGQSSWIPVAGSGRGPGPFGFPPPVG
jgi:hypothetical protein